MTSLFFNPLWPISDLAAYIWNLICNQPRRLFLPYLLQQSQKYPKLPGFTVRQLTSSTVLKSARYEVLRLEAEATKFVSQNTSIPVPKVYDIWKPRGQDHGYLVMSFVKGEMLARVWNFLTPEQRSTVMQQLAGYIKQLRALRQPHSPGLGTRGWIGTVGFRPFYDRLAGVGGLCGPFHTERAFNDWRISTYSIFGPAQKLEAIRRKLTDNHQIYFTHGNLSSRNIMVSVSGTQPEGVKITAILDWEQAGWWPEYWEATKLLWVNGEKAGYSRMARELVLPGYDEEVDASIELKDLGGVRI